MRCRACKKEIPEESVYCLHCGALQDVAHRPKSRGNGQGSVYRLKNKSWMCAVTDGYTVSADGKVKRHTRTKSGFKTKAEALEYLPLLRVTPAEERRKPKTLREVYDLWEPTHQAGRSTINCYRAARKYFEPIAGETMAKITVDDLQECLDECPKGRRTQENMKALCGLLYKYAIPRGQASMNMGQYLVIHASSGEAKEGLPMDLLERIAAAAGTVPGADYVLCQCYTGFRPSELLNLDASNYLRREKCLVGGAKTDAGKDRTVPVAPRIQPIIDRLTRDKLAGPIFCRPDGERMDIQQYRELFYSVLEAVGAENPVLLVDGVQRHKYTPHSCRHTFATLLKQVQGSDKDKLAIMGHTSGEMLRHYQDTPIEDLKKVINAI